MTFLDRLASDASEWARGRNPRVRLPLLVWLAWMFWHHLTDPEYAGLIAGLNLGVHELGHFVFALFGEFAAAAGGTVMQCIAPAIGAFMFWRQRDWFAISFAGGWLATNLYGIGLYASDARERALPLVTPGAGEPIHDWYYMLSRLGWLQHDDLIGRMFRLSGTLTMAAAIAFGAWLLWRMQTGSSGENGTA